MGVKPDGGGVVPPVEAGGVGAGAPPPQPAAASVHRARGREATRADRRRDNVSFCFTSEKPWMWGKLLRTTSLPGERLRGDLGLCTGLGLLFSARRFNRSGGL
jgi:hypothetical protein